MNAQEIWKAIHVPGFNRPFRCSYNFYYLADNGEKRVKGRYIYIITKEN
jgi:hypothetical protein